MRRSVCLDDLIVHLGRELDDLGDTAPRQLRDARGEGGPEVPFEAIRGWLARLDDPLERAGRKPHA
ncbi:MAG: hypothetical protein DCC71_19855 [Proteobacteria bacterium]|nr:MAG: hypothetical protein DCC71_19855 [Pseudomonadota bacterium]